MRRGIVKRLGAMTGSSTDPATFAKALKEEAKKACRAAGVPFEEAPPTPEAPSGAPAEQEAAAPAANSEGSGAEAEPLPEAGPQTTGHRFTAAEPEEDSIMGVPAHRVLAVAPMTLAFWGSLARKLENTRWDFSGERELTMFENTPFKRVIRANPERQLAELSAVVVAKHATKVTDKADSPEALLFGAAFFAFGPQALENVTQAWGWIKDKLRRRREA